MPTEAHVLDVGVWGLGGEKIKATSEFIPEERTAFHRTKAKGKCLRLMSSYNIGSDVNMGK